MHKWVSLYCEDALPLVNMGISEIFQYVENLPYIYDDQIDPDKEFLYRPARFKELPGLDCKKKSILIACWATLKNIPYRFLAVNDSNDLGSDGISHVFCQIFTAGNWISMDATLPNLFYPGGPMPLVRYAEVI